MKKYAKQWLLGVASAVLLLAAGGLSAGRAAALSPNTSPTITYTADPAANADGWNNSPVTVTFTCTDDFAVAYCTPPFTFTSEGANQTVEGTVMSALGTVRNITAGPINIDETMPTVGTPSLTEQYVVWRSGEAISAPVNDALSGVAGGEYYIDTDPGQGNGAPMQYADGKITANADFGWEIGFGTHKLYVRSKDKAGNWSTPASTSFFVF